MQQVRLSQLGNQQCKLHNLYSQIGEQLLVVLVVSYLFSQVSTWPCDKGSLLVLIHLTLVFLISIVSVLNYGCCICQLAYLFI